MQNSKICLAPIRFGAGIKGKLLDAMITKTPSITTTIGSEGMKNNESWPGEITDDIEIFVKKSVELYKNKQIWEEAQKKCDILLKSKYDSKILGQQLISKILKVEKELENHRLNNFTGSMLKHHTMASTKYMSQWIAEKNSKLIK